MGRDLTPQERAEFEQKRREQLEENCKRLGISVEEHERIYKGASQKERHPSERERAENVLRAAFHLIGQGFLDSLKTETHRKALDTVNNLDEMSDGEFSELLARRMSVLDEEEQAEARHVIKKRIADWDENEPLSLREVILLDLQGMIESHNYRARL